MAGDKRLPSTSVLLATVALIGLASGGLTALLGSSGAADVCWIATIVVVLIPAAWWVAAALWRRQFGADVIAVIALAGTLAVGEYLAGAVIALMFSGGQALEERAAHRARRDLAALLSLAPRFAHREGSDGLETVAVDDVQAGDRLLVRPGEVVPVDGVVDEGTAVVDESMITGEPVPVELTAGRPVPSGSVNAGSPLHLRATAAAEGSTYAGLVRLARDAAAGSAPFVRLADRYAAWFLPAALLVAGVAWALSGDAVRAVAVLVVATPCPLILAAPIAFVSGMSRCARRGVIVKGGGALDALGQARVLLFDKTGTVTAGRPTVVEVIAPVGVAGTEVLRLAGSLDQVSPHVLAAAIVDAARESGAVLERPSEVVEEPGQGVRGRVGAHEVTVGKAALMADAAARAARAAADGDRNPDEWVAGVRRRAAADGTSTVFVGVDGSVVGALLLRDRIRPDAARTFRLLRRAGIERTVMISGDRSSVARSVAARVGADAVHAEQSPAGKVEVVRAETAGGRTVMVGDGVNDAPALAAAGVGVALGARGASASSEAADVVITVDRLERLAEALAIARRTRSIAQQGALLGMGLSLVAMGAAGAGLLVPLAGAVVQEAIDVATIVNALRALGPGRSRVPRLDRDAADLVRRLDEDHRRLGPGIAAMPVLAGRLPDLEPVQRADRLRELVTFLTDDVLPHERDDERLLYPQVAETLGGTDPTATMSREHAEIAELIRRIELLTAEVEQQHDNPAVLRDLAQAIYELHAVLRLHNASEEENFHILAED